MIINQHNSGCLAMGIGFRTPLEAFSAAIDAIPETRLDHVTVFRTPASWGWRYDPGLCFSVYSQNGLNKVGALHCKRCGANVSALSDSDLCVMCESLQMIEEM